jgi:putative acetyltransferase
MNHMTDAGITIRPERADHPQVTVLLRSLDRYLGELYEPQDNHILDVPSLLADHVTFLVAEQDRRIVGCGAARRMPGEQATQHQAYGEVKRMMVLPERRGQGIGRRLLDALERTLLGDGIERALLETGERQRAAVRLYERCGYRRRGPFGGYPDNGLSVFFEKRLAR